MSQTVQSSYKTFSDVRTLTAAGRGGWEGPAAVSLMHRFLTGLTHRLCRASRLHELSYVKQNYSLAAYSNGSHAKK